MLFKEALLWHQKQKVYNVILDVVVVTDEGESDKYIGQQAMGRRPGAGQGESPRRAEKGRIMPPAGEWFDTADLQTPRADA